MINIHSYVTNAHFFKYSGKELDRMHGLNWYDHGARMSDPALGRWHVVDPLCEKYYDVSPYVVCANDPVNFVDNDGRDVLIWYTNSEGRRKTFRFNGFHGKSHVNIPKNAPFIKAFIEAYKSNKKYGGKNTVKAVEDHNYTIYIGEANPNPLYGGPEFDAHLDEDNVPHQPTVYWNASEGLMTENGGQSPATILEHEFAHAVKHTNSILNKDGKYEKDRNTPTYDDYDNVIERDIITEAERKTEICNKESIRNNHRSKRLYTTIKSTSTIRKKR